MGTVSDSSCDHEKGNNCHIAKYSSSSHYRHANEPCYQNVLRQLISLEESFFITYFLLLWVMVRASPSWNGCIYLQLLFSENHKTFANYVSFEIIQTFYLVLTNAYISFKTLYKSGSDLVQQKAINQLEYVGTLCGYIMWVHYAGIYYVGTLCGYIMWVYIMWVCYFTLGYIIIA